MKRNGSPVAAAAGRAAGPKITLVVTIAAAKARETQIDRTPRFISASSHDSTATRSASDQENGS
jgi:hypothetical protein